jgi:hypothetical protein
VGKLTVSPVGPGQTHLLVVGVSKVQDTHTFSIVNTCNGSTAVRTIALVLGTNYEQFNLRVHHYSCMYILPSADIMWQRLWALVGLHHSVEIFRNIPFM